MVKLELLDATYRLVYSLEVPMTMSPSRETARALARGYTPPRGHILWVTIDGQSFRFTPSQLKTLTPNYIAHDYAEFDIEAQQDGEG